MRAIKGFATHSLFVSNVLGAVNNIGELSTQALTYSKEIGYYTNDTAPDITLATFLSALSGTPEQLSIAIRDHTLSVIKYIYQKTLNTQGEIYSDQLLLQLLTQFQTSATDFECGEIVTDGNYYIPEWVSWVRKDDGVENYTKIWFSDQSFRQKYDEFEIVVVPPIARLDDFFKTFSNVTTIVESRDSSEAMDIVQLAKNGHPETILRAELYDYINPLNASQKLSTSWTLLIYGAAGNNVDSIKDALVSYILANSTHTREEWVQILPDIFRRTEFLVIPFWNHYAIPNRTTQAGIYSPVVSLQRAATEMAEYAPGYTQSHINAHAQVMGYPYNSITLGVVGGIENRDGLYEVDMVYPDLVAVSPTSQDFNRMSADTRAFSTILSQMLLVTETMSQYSDIPNGMTKVVRDGILYLVKNVNNIHYLVAAKSNFSIT